MNAPIEVPPRVSVIMPVYGTTPFVPQAIDSVLAQTYPYHELIVVNDGTPDSSDLDEVTARYRGQIVYIKQENRGSSAARNTALKLARGEYVAILDSDDYWHPEYLASQISVLDADPKLDVVYPDAIWFSPDGKEFRRFSDEHVVGGEISFVRLLDRQVQVYGGATARRECVLRVGMYDEQLRTGEDFDLWLRIVKSGGRITYNDRVLAYYRGRYGSLTSDRTSLLRNMLTLLDRLEHKVDLTREERLVLDRQRARTARSLALAEGKQAILAGDRSTAIRRLIAASEIGNNWKLCAAVLSLRIAPGLTRYLYRLRQRSENPL